MRVVYFGSGAFGLPTLEALAHRHELAAVVTQPDRRAGRGGRTTPTPVGAWAAEGASAPVFKPENVNESDVREAVRAIEADAWVVIAFGQKLGRALLADRFAVNLHASLLPRWRGAAPINHAVLAGDAETGNSVITLAERMDAGLVLGQTRRVIEPSRTAGELHDLLAGDGPELVLDVLDRHTAGTLEPLDQDESLVTLAPKLSKPDGLLEWGAAAAAVRRRVHGLTPWPGAFAELDGEPIRIGRVEEGGAIAEQASGRGSAGELCDPEAGLVRCGDGASVRLLEVQRPGKRLMSWAEFQNGRKLAAGVRFGDGR